MAFYAVIVALFQLLVTYLAARIIKNKAEDLVESQERGAKFNTLLQIKNTVEDTWKEHNEYSIILNFKKIAIASYDYNKSEKKGIKDENMKKLLDSSLNDRYTNLKRDFKNNLSLTSVKNILRDLDTLGLLTKRGTIPIDFLFDFYSRRIVVMWYYLYDFKKFLKDRNELFIGTKFEVLARFAYNFRINTSKRDSGGTPSFIDREPFLLDPNTLPRTDMQADRCDWTKTMWFEDPSFKEKIRNFGLLTSNDTEQIIRKSKNTEDANEKINEETKKREKEFLIKKQGKYFTVQSQNKYYQRFKEYLENPDLYSDNLKKFVEEVNRNRDDKN